MILHIRRDIGTIINISVLRESAAKRDRALYNTLENSTLYVVITWRHFTFDPIKMDKRNDPSCFNLVSRFPKLD